MNLTSYQQELLDGAHGKGKAMAMRIQTVVGEAFGARELVPVTRAHVALSAQEADTWFASKLLDAGAVCAVSPTVNPGYDLSFFTARGLVDEVGSALMRRTHEVYRALGATLTYSCTPYLFENIPRYGEIAAFSETSATVYVNSVLGARTHRESSASALCAAVTGFTPLYGMLLPQNRRATVLVDVRARVETPFDYALLGLTAPKLGGGVPVFTGLAPHMTTESLITLGTQLNVAGVCDLYHIVGVTPDARDVCDALGGAAPERTVTVTDEDLEAARRAWSPHRKDEPLEFVMLGCPHYTWRQVCELSALLEGRRAKAAVWVLTSSAVLELATRTGLTARLTELGCTLVAGTCVDEAACWSHLRGASGVTDSPKCAYYMRSFGVEPTVHDTKTCVRWALEGRTDA